MLTRSRSPRRFFALVLALAAAPSTLVRADETPSAPPLKRGVPARIVALGDSITRGSSNGLGNYRRPLQSLLAKAGYIVTFAGTNTEQSDNYNGQDPEQLYTPYQRGHEGYGGFRIDQIGSGANDKDDGGVAYPGLSTALDKANPDVVLLMIGTNDINRNYDPPGGVGYNGKEGFSANAAARLDNLVTRIHALKPAATLVLGTITPLRNADRQTKVVSYNAFIAQIVAAHQQAGEKIVLADMGTALNNTDLASDGVHPTTQGYDKMARTWFVALTGEAAPPLPNPILTPAHAPLPTPVQ